MKMRTRMVELVFEQMIVSLQFVLSRFGIKLFVGELSRIVCVSYYQMPSYVVFVVSPRYIGTLTYKYIVFAGFFRPPEVTTLEASPRRFLIVKGQI